MNATPPKPATLLALTVAAGLLLVALAPSGCGTARRSEPLAGPLPVAKLDPAQAESARRGEVVFATNCYQCHPGGAAGLGPGLNDKPLPGFAIKTQVRRGVGAMPTFPEEEISDDALDDLITYLVALRRNELEPSAR